MAKKKAKLTPKDDLIESLMNDVREIDDRSPPEDPQGGQSLLLDEERSSQADEDFLVGFGGNESRADDEGEDAAALWKPIKEFHPEMPAPPSEISNLENLGAPLAKPSLEPLAVEIPKPPGYDDKTMNLGAKENDPSGSSFAVQSESGAKDAEKTLAVEGFANRQPRSKTDHPPKISFGSLREPSPAPASGKVYASADATLAQAESLKLAQQRILELEKECEKYRQENEELASAGEIIRNRSEELNARILALEKEKQEAVDSLNNDLMIVKSTLQYKESEMAKARFKIEELQARLKSDFKKIRVRERELENRLELVKAEKSALLRAKDENILELKRKIDHIQGELDNYREKVLELNKTLELNQEQFKRTVRALRLALSNLEVKEENIVPLKKAD